jgi:16S rRNA (guanine966-N2)-methyltransferase
MANVRIIGGNWRHRKVNFPSSYDIRPSPDRVRETLFNWLQGEVAGRHCLEPFAGSGILSFEALSRGAAHVAMNDLESGIARALGEEAKKLGADSLNYLITRQDGYALMKEPPKQTQLVFLDPPFHSGRYGDLFESIHGSEAFSREVLIYVESGRPLNKSEFEPFGFRAIKSKQAGRVSFALFARSA